MRPDMSKILYLCGFAGHHNKKKHTVKQHNSDKIVTKIRVIIKL